MLGNIITFHQYTEQDSPGSDRREQLDDEEYRPPIKRRWSENSVPQNTNDGSGHSHSYPDDDDDWRSLNYKGEHSNPHGWLYQYAADAPKAVRSMASFASPRGPAKLSSARGAAAPAIESVMSGAVIGSSAAPVTTPAIP